MTVFGDSFVMTTEDEPARLEMLSLMVHDKLTLHSPVIMTSHAQITVHKGAWLECLLPEGGKKQFGARIFNHGKITGNLNISGLLYNEGSLLSANDTASAAAQGVGTIEVHGMMEFGGVGTYYVDVYGVTPGQYSTVHVNGLAVFGGFVVIDLKTSFLEHTNASIEFIRYLESVGEFEKVVVISALQQPSNMCVKKAKGVVSLHFDCKVVVVSEEDKGGVTGAQTDTVVDVPVIDSTRGKGTNNNALLAVVLTCVGVVVAVTAVVAIAMWKNHRRPRRGGLWSVRSDKEEDEEEDEEEKEGKDVQLEMKSIDDSTDDETTPALTRPRSRPTPLS